MKLTQLRCPSCDGVIEADTTGKEFIFCTYCGSKVRVDDEHQTVDVNLNVNENINETKNIRITDEAEILKEKNRQKSNRSFGPIMTLIFIVSFGGTLYFSHDLKQQKEEAISRGEISINCSYEDFQDKNFKTVKAQFKAAGFTNIQVIDLDDADNDKIESVSIGGDSKFEESDYFAPDTQVVISHH